jgi:hypothetical protein
MSVESGGAVAGTGIGVPDATGGAAGGTLLQQEQEGQGL